MVFFIATGVSGTTQAPQADAPTRVIVSADAPIYVTADASRTALRVAKIGTTLNVINRISGWLEIEFNDPQWGRRVGFIEQKNVEQFSKREAMAPPLDLSVSASGADAPAATPVGVAPACRVYVTDRVFPPAYFRKIKDVKWARKWYGGADAAYQKLADEAWKVDADAVIQADTSYRPSGFSWASAHAVGTAVKWTEEGRRHFGELKGQCYERSSSK